MKRILCTMGSGASTSMSNLLMRATNDMYYPASQVSAGLALFPFSAIENLVPNVSFPVKFSGILRPVLKPLTSPIAQIPCVSYSLLIYVRSGADNPVYTFFGEDEYTVDFYVMNGLRKYYVQANPVTNVVHTIGCADLVQDSSTPLVQEYKGSTRGDGVCLLNGMRVIRPESTHTATTLFDYNLNHELLVRVRNRRTRKYIMFPLKISHDFV